MSEIFIIVKSIINNELNETVDLVNEHNLKKDLDLDSLSLVCIGIEIEKEFGTVINEAEMELVETVGELIEMVEKSVKTKN